MIFNKNVQVLNKYQRVDNHKETKLIKKERQIDTYLIEG